MNEQLSFLESNQMEILCQALQGKRKKLCNVHRFYKGAIALISYPGNKDSYYAPLIVKENGKYKNAESFQILEEGE
jgi:hypothetical protein